MTKNFSKSIKAKLLNMARNNGLDYQVLLTRFLYERLLYRLAVSRFKEKFCLKGGALLYAFEKEFSRPTLDIDLLGLKIKNDASLLIRIFTEIMSIPYENDGVVFDTNSLKTENIAEKKAYNGIRILFIAHLDSIRQRLQIDIGFGDVLIPEAQLLPYPVLIRDLPVPDILAYSLETVVAEKFHAMLDLAESNSRHKDFYDIYRILSQNELNEKHLIDAIRATFNNRKMIFKENHPLFTQSFYEDKNRQIMWKAFLRKIKYAENLEFSDVMKCITERLYPIYHEIRK